MDILYEDNHIIAINKRSSDIVQGDDTHDETLPDKVKQYLKEKYDKRGNVFCGVVHRLDRPVSGVVLFAKTSKALTRLSVLFQTHEIEKIYWAIVKTPPEYPEGRLAHYIVRNEKQNKSYAYDSQRNTSKQAVLTYRTLSQSENFTLLEIFLETGRHHQIRCQLAKVGSPIKGDLKYGYPRSNPDGGVSLHARSVQFIHPIHKKPVYIVAPIPDDKLWREITAHNG
ncbi:MAG: RluA family pseudouridine synthase [Prevotellaceae bacterium]|jgi:23S rRNA pseudouridine1911/1915/1917 synthase|nr:RluA family pseudouridine synthase [Prevotellaceae bacterium]